MIPLPTNARSFMVAFFRHNNVEEETISAIIDDVVNEPGIYLMTLGGAVGVAELERGVSLVFGTERDLNKVLPVVKEVFNIPTTTPISTIEGGIFNENV